MATKKKSTATTAANETTPENTNVIDSKSATRGTGKKTKTVAAVAPVSNGVIGSATTTVTVNENPTPVAPATTVEKVAIFSTKNVHWDGVGAVKRGYNILPKSIAEKWLATRSSHTRLATPEEVAKEFGA